MSEVYERFSLPPSPHLAKLDASAIDTKDVRTWLLCVGCKNEETAKNGVLRYLGYPKTGQKNLYSVRDDVSKELELCYQITSHDDVDSLSEADFINPKV
jgi:hypothetical protein